MYTTSDLVASGIGLSITAAAFALIGGPASALRWGRNAFFSIGLFMIFSGWLQFINFDGGWPSDQPPDKENYRRLTKADERRIRDAMGEMSTMSKQDWDDYHRCKDMNVCVRRFQGQRKEVGGVAPTSNVSTPSNISQPKFESGTSSPTTETRCVLMDGVLKCHEYIRR